MKIENSIVLVTGANRGIGKAYVEEFLKQGAAKIYLGVRDPSSVKDIVSKNPDKLIPIKLDVTKQSEIDAAAKTAKDVNILVNNAGVATFAGMFEKETPENARNEMEVNYFAPLSMIRAFAPVLKANGGGAIATVASIVSHVAFPGIATYSASKAATHSLIKSARQELQSQGTLVVGVYPGPIDTDMAADIEMDKVPPSQVAQETIKAIKENAEDVFPDEFSRSLYESAKADPKAVEAQMLAQAA